MEDIEIKQKVEALMEDFSKRPAETWHSAIKSLGFPFDGEKNSLRRKAYRMLQKSVEIGCWFIVFVQSMQGQKHVIVNGKHGKAAFYHNDFNAFIRFCN